MSEIPPPPGENVPTPPTAVPPPPPPVTQADFEEAPVMYLDSGKVLPPPSAVDLEEVILGAMLIDKKGVEEAMPLLSVDVWYEPKHRLIFEAIQSLYDKGVGVDLLTVSAEMKRLGTIAASGGEFYLIQLTQKVSSSAHIEFHIRIVMQKYVLRELIDISRVTINDSLHRDPDVFEMMDRYDQKVSYVNSVILKGSGNGYGDPTEELQRKVDKNRAGETPGIYTGVSDFDSWCGGFQPRELITIAARPGIGKTTSGLSMAIEGVTQGGHKATFFSLEMSKTDLYFRLAARLQQIDYSRIRVGDLTDDELHRVKDAMAYLDRCDLNVFDTSSHKNMYAKLVKLIRDEVKRGSQIIWIDYVQLIKLVKYSKDRTAELSTITRELKALANELNVPIVIFAQLSRNVDNREGHIPRLSDLKQSGSIEEDSDTVIFLTREAYYKSLKNQGIELPPHMIGDTQMIVAKGRNIGTGTFRTFLDFFKYSFTSYGDAELNL